MSVNGSISIRVAGTEKGASDYGSPIFSAGFEHIVNLANGTLANQADLVFFDERSVNASSNDDIDLTGVLTTALGASFAAAKIVTIVVINKQKDGTANVSNLTIGGGSNPFLGFLGGTTPTIGPIPPGGFFAIGSPALAGVGSVTGGSADILRVANGSGGTNKYQIAIFARTA